MLTNRERVLCVLCLCADKKLTTRDVHRRLRISVPHVPLKELVEMGLISRSRKERPPGYPQAVTTYVPTRKGLLRFAAYERTHPVTLAALIDGAVGRPSGSDAIDSAGLGNVESGAAKKRPHLIYAYVDLDVSQRFGELAHDLSLSRSGLMKNAVEMATAEEVQNSVRTIRDRPDVRERARAARRDTVIVDEGRVADLLTATPEGTTHGTLAAALMELCVTPGSILRQSLKAVLPSYEHLRVLPSTTGRTEGPPHRHEIRFELSASEKAALQEWGFQHSKSPNATAAKYLTQWATQNEIGVPVDPSRRPGGRAIVNVTIQVPRDAAGRAYPLSASFVADAIERALLRRRGSDAIEDPSPREAHRPPIAGFNVSLDAEIAVELNALARNRRSYATWLDQAVRDHVLLQPLLGPTLDGPVAGRFKFRVARPILDLVEQHGRARHLPIKTLAKQLVLANALLVGDPRNVTEVSRRKVVAHDHVRAISSLRDPNLTLRSPNGVEYVRRLAELESQRLRAEVGEQLSYLVDVPDFLQSLGRCPAYGTEQAYQWKLAAGARYCAYLAGTASDRNGTNAERAPGKPCRDDSRPAVELG